MGGEMWCCEEGEMWCGEEGEVREQGGGMRED